MKCRCERHECKANDAGFCKVDDNDCEDRISSSLSTPLLCPFCMWDGLDDDIKMEFEETPSGIHVTGGVKWTCPACESVVHEEDEGYGTNFIHDHRLKVNGKPVMGPGSNGHNAR